MDYLIIGMIMALLYFILAAADFYSTALVLSSGVGHEANPLMNKLMDIYGIDAAFWAQVLSWILIAGVVLLYPSEETVAGLIIVLILKGVIVLNNLLNATKVWKYACKGKGGEGGGTGPSKTPRGGVAGGNELPSGTVWFG